MSRLKYMLFLLAKSQILGLALVLLTGGIILQGKEAVSAGYIWAYSLPAAFVLALLIGALTWRTYLQLNGTPRRLAFLTRLNLIVIVLAPLVTFGILKLFQMAGLFN